MEWRFPSNYGWIKQSGSALWWNSIMNCIILKWKFRLVKISVNYAHRLIWFLNALVLSDRWKVKRLVLWQKMDPIRWPNTVWQRIIFGVNGDVDKPTIYWCSAFWNLHMIWKMSRFRCKIEKKIILQWIFQMNWTMMIRIFFLIIWVFMFPINLF